MFDLDFFKRVNDTYGHPVGDLCLKEVANLSLPQLRKTDLLARYGGEEFLVVLPETTRPQAKEAAEKLRANIDRTEFILGPHSLRLTISLGVAEVKDSDRDPETVLKRSDRALYEAKNGGRNRVEVG
jgi:diguanylate cyclase (GGDEF)-like protein